MRVSTSLDPTTSGLLASQEEGFSPELWSTLAKGLSLNAQNSGTSFLLVIDVNGLLWCEAYKHAIHEARL